MTAGMAVAMHEGVREILRHRTVFKIRIIMTPTEARHKRVHHNSLRGLLLTFSMNVLGNRAPTRKRVAANRKTICLGFMECCPS
jgi:hypothetical protein